MKPYTVTTLSDVQPEAVEWAWNGYIPLGKHTDVCGDPGLGKSTGLLDIGARFTRCAPMPDGSTGVHGAVIILTAEDGLADTIRPRFDAAGGDPDWLHTFTIGPDGDLPTFPENAPELEAVIVETAAKLVIIDPAFAFVGSEINSFRDHDIRRALAPLARIGERTGAAIVTIRHLTKSPGVSALYRGGGSIGFIGAVRSAFLVAVDPNDPERRIFASVKSNLAPRPPALAFTIEAHGGSSRVRWLGQSEHTADELVRPPDPAETADPSEAESLLSGLLADGPITRRQVIDGMRRNGFSERSTDRAAQRLNVIRTSHGFGSEKQSVWKLPIPATSPTSVGNGGNGGNGAIGFPQFGQENLIPAISDNQANTDGAGGNGDYEVEERNALRAGL